MRKNFLKSKTKENLKKTKSIWKGKVQIKKKKSDSPRKFKKKKI